MPTRLPEREFDARLASVRERIAQSDADAGVWFDATSIEYLTGFAHLQTERPVVLGVTEERCEITVPRLEVERVSGNSRIDRVHSYFDYPGGGPIEIAAGMLREMDADSVVADADGAPGTMGYEGPELSGFLDVETRSWVARMRWAKSDAEVELIRESAKWANLGHRHLAECVEPGAHPATASQRAPSRPRGRCSTRSATGTSLEHAATGPSTRGSSAASRPRFPTATPRTGTWKRATC